MARFKDPKKRLRIRGLGIVSSSNLTNELAGRIIKLNPAYAKFLEDYGESKKESKGSSRKRKPKAAASEETAAAAE